MKTEYIIEWAIFHVSAPGDIISENSVTQSAVGS